MFDRSSPITAFAAMPATIRGALWMTVGTAGFAVAAGIIRHTSAELHTFEIVFFRNLFALFIMLPWVMRQGAGALRTKRIGLYTFRACLALTAMISWYTAITLVPLGDAVALSFTAPIFTTILAGIFLHEVIRARRWSAVLVGFLGVLVILRPGFETVDPNLFIVIVSSVAFAGSGIVIKILSRTDSPNAIVTWMAIYLTPLSLVPALFVWRTPEVATLLWLVALAAATTTGHIGLTRAYAVAEATAVQPFAYVHLPFVAIVGYIAFGEVPTAWTWIGAAIIAAACLYIAHREARATDSARAGTATAAGQEGPVLQATRSDRASKSEDRGAPS